nr:hypothetical protein [uncultured Roseateles sp.]
MSTPYRRDLERLQYWQGQTLRSRDARDQQRFEALRRQLHNRALHETGGIAFGLVSAEVTEDGTGQVTGIEVACGLAYDRRGRELILQRARRVPLPTEAAWLVLRLRATRRGGGGNGSGTCCVPDEPGCVLDDARLLESDVELAWVPIAANEAPDGAVLARYDGGLKTDFRPPRVRPLARPRLARGETVEGGTPWEPWIVESPDGHGGIVSKVVGVQTRVDTSASGFTEVPRYVANVQARSWNLAKAEFAPAFFPEVADPAVDGFTFRLLMTEIGRRRIAAWYGQTRVSAIRRGAGDQLSIDLDDAAVFKPNDVIALLRPRARTAVSLTAAEGSTVTLAAPLDGVRVDDSVLALGNLPRLAEVVTVPDDSAAMLADYTAAPAIKKGDVLRRDSDGAVALIDGVSAGRMTVEQPPPAWKESDELHVARMTDAIDIKRATLSADGKSLQLELKSAPQGLDKGARAVLLDADRQPLATAPEVTVSDGVKLELQPPPTAAEVATLTRAVPLSGGLTIQRLVPKARSEVGVSDVAPFAVGDVVAPMRDLSLVAVVDKIVKKRKALVLSAGLGLAVGDRLVAADWCCATTIDAFEPKRPNEVRVGRASAARVKDVLRLRVADGAESPPPASVAAVTGTLLGLGSPLVETARRLDLLAVGRFGRVATVVAQQTDETRITLAESAAFAVGDCVMAWPLIGSVTLESAVAQVVAIVGVDLVLSGSPGALATGDRLATVHWRDSARITRVDADPRELDVADDLVFGPNDVAGLLVHHADVSNGAYVQQIVGNTVTVRPTLAQGDGIVDQGWIDGGLVGPAALTWDPARPMDFPATWQPLVRMDSAGGLDGRAIATLYGLDLNTGVYQSRAAWPYPIDAELHLYAVTPATTPAYRFRPETLSLITSFNSDFPAAFVTFAQKKRLVVRWFGCQQEFRPVTDCPGQTPGDPCA